MGSLWLFKRSNRDSSRRSHLTRRDFTQSRCISASVKTSPKATSSGLFAPGWVPAACFDWGVPAWLHPTAGSPRSSAGASKGRADLQHLCTTQTRQRNGGGRSPPPKAAKTHLTAVRQAPGTQLSTAPCALHLPGKKTVLDQTFSAAPSLQRTGGTPRSVTPRCVAVPRCLRGPASARAAAAGSCGPAGSGACEPPCPRCHRAHRLPRE